jgi:lysine 6-dehydrogenase
MEVVVVGGGGLTGRCAVRDLARGGKFDRIRVADLDLELARDAARRAGSPKVEPERTDVRNRAEMVKLLRGATVCVNAVQFQFNLNVMEACLEARVPYLDFGGLFHMTRRQLEWDERFRSAGLLAIPGLGQVPGASNILAELATRDLAQVDSIVIRDAWRDFSTGAPEVWFTWSPSTFIDEMQFNAVIWTDGEYREVPPMSAAETFDFAAPVGPTTVYRTLHSEAATLPESLRAKGVRHVEWKEGGPGIDVLRTLAQLGLGSDAPVDVGGRPVIPRQFLLALLRHRKLLGVPEGVVVNDWEVCDLEIRGRTAGGSDVVRHAVARFPPKPEWSLAATEYAVGVCGAIGAEMIAAGEIRATGVVPPERCVPGERFRAELGARGIETAISPPEAPLAPLDARARTTGS